MLHFLFLAQASIFAGEERCDDSPCDRETSRIKIGLASVNEGEWDEKYIFFVTAQENMTGTPET